MTGRRSAVAARRGIDESRRPRVGRGDGRAPPDPLSGPVNRNICLHGAELNPRAPGQRAFLPFRPADKSTSARATLSIVFTGLGLRGAMAGSRPARPTNRQIDDRPTDRPAALPPPSCSRRSIAIIIHLPCVNHSCNCAHFACFTVNNPQLGSFSNFVFIYVFIRNSVPAGVVSLSSPGLQCFFRDQKIISKF